MGEVKGIAKGSDKMEYPVVMSPSLLCCALVWQYQGPVESITSPALSKGPLAMEGVLGSPSGQAEALPTEAEEVSVPTSLCPGKTVAI
jgi:hypothetical protein